MAKNPKAETKGPIDWILLGTTVALIAVGLMMVYSSTSDLGYRDYHDAAYFFKRQSMWLGIGVLAMLVASRLDYRHWMKVSIPIMAVTLLMLLFLVVFRKDERHMIGQSISPVELAKLAVIIYIGHWLSSRGDLLRKLPYGLLPFTIMVGVVAGLVLAQPDISEAMVIVLVAVAMFFLAGADLLQFVIGIVGGLGAFAFVINHIPQAMERLMPFFKDWQNPLTSNNDQLREGLLALGSGGLLGLGPGSGRMKYGWLPAAHTDSIFAIVGEELGLVGCLLLIGLFALLVYRGLRIAILAPDTFGRLLASGITCWIGAQALINMAVVTGTMPFTGIALPFISVGGSSLVTCMIGVGIMLSISRSVGMEPARMEVQTPRANRRRTSNLEPGTPR
jgi:cell division protein FtsW